LADQRETSVTSGAVFRIVDIAAAVTRHRGRSSVAGASVAYAHLPVQRETSVTGGAVFRIVDIAAAVTRHRGRSSVAGASVAYAQLPV
jgi:hypothetical protein